MKRKKPLLGLYIHIPFCKSKCLYCDFCSLPHQTDDTVEMYVRALCRDLARRSCRAAGYEVDTVYLGGGTPTYLSAGQLERIMETVRDCYLLTPDAEITAECNPVTNHSPLFHSLYYGAGINRLSIGLQSIHEGELRALGRIHRYRDFLETVENARCYGFENISADLMIGIPHQTPESLHETLEQVSSLGLKHISAYMLSVEEGTPFYRMRDRLVLPDEDAVADMYEDAVAFLEQKGYHRYEISNFAPPGYESRHNLKYWDCRPYLGFGPGAHSCFEGVRSGNSRDIAAYIRGESIEESRHVLSPAEEMNEYVMLRMRLAEGVKKGAFKRRFRVSFDPLFGEKFQPYIENGLVKDGDKSLSFTARGFAVSNAVLADVLDFSSDD